jgi:hypothetical protein
VEAELKEFLERIASSLDKRIDRLGAELRSEMAAMEGRLNARIDGVGLLTKDALRTFRTRDFRILVLEERANEVEKRLLDVEGQKPE